MTSLGGESTMSLNIITVTLNLDTVNFLGISIVGQSNKGGEGGIYVGSIMRGGAVAQDGRIEPGDMILQVNETSLEDMSNDDAVRVLRQAVMKPGTVKLVVAKCWDPNPKGYFTVSKQEPVRPIDPSAWIAHTQAHTHNANHYKQQQHKRLINQSISSFGSTSSLATSINGGGGNDTTLTSDVNDQPGHIYGGGTYGGHHQNYYQQQQQQQQQNYGHYHPHYQQQQQQQIYQQQLQHRRQQQMQQQQMLGDTLQTTTTSDSTASTSLNLTANSDMDSVVRAMAAAGSGLNVCDHHWLKLVFPESFTGADLVDWLFTHVEGFPDRRDARKYACNMLK